MIILGFETSCDETAVSLVEDGRNILSNVIASQVELHARYGGVVPEIASRQHLLEIIPTIRSAFSLSGLGWGDVDAVAVTKGPGLAGSLLVGVNVAKSLAFSKRLPLIGINHLEGHIYANWLEGHDPGAESGFPLICLITSGGHTDLVLMEDIGKYVLLGRTRDDAAGEAFDKAARILGLGFPGGPLVQKASEGAKGTEILPRAWLKGTDDFSFSGIKTALLNKVKDRGVYPLTGNSGPDSTTVREMASAFQESVSEVMAVKTIDAARRHKARGIILGGGVAANSKLRAMLRDMSPVALYIPSPSLCTDNGAMIGAAGYFQTRNNLWDSWDMDIYPNLGFS
jgi:N6-L-threonylcarbamoyladenine synthase